MSSAAADRFVMGRRSHRRTTRSRQRARNIAASARRDADARVAKAADDVRFAEARIASLLDASTRLEEFERHWLTSGFFHRVWNATRYVFIGSEALPG